MEWRLFDPEHPPAFLDPDWYATSGRAHAPHLEQVEHQPRLQAARALVAQALTTLSLSRPEVADLGAGDGGLLSLVQHDHPDAVCYGFDLHEPNVRHAVHTRGIDVSLRNVVTDWPWGQEYADVPPDLVLATEFLEHLANPGEVLRRVHHLRCPYLVVSSPHDETPDDHYEFHAWAWDAEGYTALLVSAGWAPVRTETVGQFQVVLAERV